MWFQGGTRVLIYEVVSEDPYFLDCSSFSSPEPHKVLSSFLSSVTSRMSPSRLYLLLSCVQGLAFLPKTQCNVHDVEIAVALMLTKSTIEPVAFRVPRVKVRQQRRSVGK